MKNSYIGKHQLILISLISIINLRNIALLASNGLGSILYYLLAAILFLIPSAFICAQNASLLPQEGGIYLWVKSSLGKNIGFFTIWSEWINNIIGFPATLVFLTGAVFSLIVPNIMQHQLTMICSMLAILWLLTLLNLQNIKISTRISTWGAVIGTVFPTVIFCLIALYSLMYMHGLSHQISINPISLKHTNLSLLVTCIAGYSGMQVTAFFTQNTRNPKQNIPRAMVLSIVVVLILTILPTLAITLIVPQDKLSIVTGLSQTLSLIFSSHGNWLGIVTEVCICIGVFSSVSTWMLALAKGLSSSAMDGFLSKKLSYIGKHKQPSKILLLQATTVSILIVALGLSHHLQQGFWVLSILTGQFTMIMFAIVFIASIKLRLQYKQNISKGFLLSKPVTIIFSLLGLFACTLGYCLSYISPHSLHIRHYHEDIYLATLVYLAVPLITIFRKKRCAAESIA